MIVLFIVVSFIMKCVNWMCLFSTIVFGIVIVVDFDLSLPVRGKFFSQMIVEL